MTVQFLRLFAWLVLIIACCFSGVVANDVTGFDDLANPSDDGAPRIISIPVKNAVLGQSYSYDVYASGNPRPSYSFLQSPNGMVIDKISGLIQWYPYATGVFNVTVVAVNSFGSYIQSYSITVTPAPQSPSITSTPPASVLTTESFFYDVHATGYPPPIHILTEAPPGMTIEAASGQINWDPTGTGSYDVSLYVENSEGSDTQGFVLNVYEFPVITSEPDTTATMNNLYQYDVEATGSPAPAYTLTEFPEGMTINNANGLIDWTPDSAGHVNVTIQVGNPAGVVIQEFVLRVESVYDSPSFLSQPVTAGTVGQLYTYEVIVVGVPDPTLSLAQAPSQMTIDTETGIVQWTPTSDGDFDVWVQADNQAGSIIQNFTVVVEKADEIPSIVSSPVLEAISGELYSYNVMSAGYPEPVFSLDLSPGGMTIDPLSGLIQWTPSAGGNYEVRVAAANTWGTDFQEFSIHTDAPESPFIISIPVTTGGTGQLYTYDVAAAGFPEPLFYLDVSPGNMTIDSITGLILWRPYVPGDYEMTIRATNSVSSFTQSFQIKVSEVFQAPAITTTPLTAAEVGVAYFYDADVLGYPIPTFSLLQAPAGMTVAASTGIVEWTPDSYGSWNVELQAINSVGNAVQSFVVSTSCCGMFTQGQTGNTNCDDAGLRDLADITRLIDNVYISKADLCCTGNGNVNGDLSELINLADITRLIDHVYITKSATEACL